MTHVDIPSVSPQKALISVSELPDYQCERQHCRTACCVCCCLCWSRQKRIIQVIFFSWPPRCTDVETLLETVGVMIKMLPTRSVNYKDLLENTVSLISFKDTANQHIFKKSVCWILTFQQTLDFHVRRWSTRGCRARSQWSNPAFTVWHPWIFWRRPGDNFQMCLWRQKPDSVDGKSGQLQPCL